MLKALRQSTWMRVTAVILILCELAPVAYAEEDGTAVENVRFEVTGEVVYIYYDLLGPADKVHTVTLNLYRESDKLFFHKPFNISGDVGSVVFPGKRRRIGWEFTKEFPDGLTGDDYYFIVEATRVETPGIPMYVWIGGGAVVVGGALAILLLSGSENPPPPPGGGFPPPPGRP